MNGNKWKLVGAIGGILGLLTGGLKIWEFGAGLASEAKDRAALNAEWHLEVEIRLCNLEGGRWWRGECSTQ